MAYIVSKPNSLFANSTLCHDYTSLAQNQADLSSAHDTMSLYQNSMAFASVFLFRFFDYFYYSAKSSELFSGPNWDLIFVMMSGAMSMIFATAS
jgi:hypothetical protein